MIDFSEMASYFPQLNEKINDKKIVYLDSAATNLKLGSVIDLVTTYYKKECANVHRGIHTLSEISTSKYENTRTLVSEFLNSPKREQIIFTKGTTESLNLIALSYGESTIKAGDEIIISTMEHHSNIVPWQMLCERKGATLKVIPINDAGEIIFDEYKKLLSDKTKIVSVAYISNALGTINPIKEMIDIAHAAGAIFIIDAAQATAHLKVDVQELDCDFLATSAHKMFGPTGVGILYGKEELLNAMPPVFGGGDMIDVVTFEKTTYNVIPQKFEAGTPNIAGVIGLAPAIEFINEAGLENIAKYEHELLTYATQKLSSIPELKIIGTAKNKSAVVSFIIEDIHPHDIATLANKYAIAIRTGHHCTQPLMKRMNVPATARASFSIYNTKEDVDKLFDTLTNIINLFK
jgi:cysteine desulfurase/selenocysteine lyase